MGKKNKKKKSKKSRAGFYSAFSSENGRVREEGASLGAAARALPDPATHRCLPTPAPPQIFPGELQRQAGKGRPLSRAPKRPSRLSPLRFPRRFGGAMGNKWIYGGIDPPVCPRAAVSSAGPGAPCPFSSWLPPDGGFPVNLPLHRYPAGYRLKLAPSIWKRKKPQKPKKTKPKPPSSDRLVRSVLSGALEKRAGYSHDLTGPLFFGQVLEAKPGSAE